MNLKFLNADSKNSIAFLPHGVTTIEFSVDGDDKSGYIRPVKSTLGASDKRYVGFADDTQDFLVVWGAGKESGQFVKSDSNERMFLQVIHLKNDHDSEKITFINSEKFAWNQEVSISRASSDDVVKMKIGKDGETRRITFEGSKLPMYYPRWFPPRPTKGEKIEYVNLKLPEISIEYVENDAGVNSPVSIFLQVGDQKKKIGYVHGDLKYSYPHAEIFSLLPDKGIFVLRLWLYWIHKRFDGNAYYSFEVTDELGKDYRQVAQQMTLEIPDIERFDFVLDVNKGKIVWYGTDFHYQEYWGSVKDDVVDARIALNYDLVIQSLSRIPFRFNVPDNYNPIESLKRIILGEEKESKSLELSVEDRTCAEAEFRAFLNVRTHVPYVKNSNSIDKILISSIVSGKTN